MKSKEYEKISNDVKKHFEEVKKKRKLFYVNDEGDTTEATFDYSPTKDEIESLLIYLNKDSIAQA